MISMTPRTFLDGPISHAVTLALFAFGLGVIGATLMVYWGIVG